MDIVWTIKRRNHHVDCILANSNLPFLAEDRTFRFRNSWSVHGMDSLQLGHRQEGESQKQGGITIMALLPLSCWLVEVLFEHVVNLQGYEKDKKVWRRICKWGSDGVLLVLRRVREKDSIHWLWLQIVTLKKFRTRGLLIVNMLPSRIHVWSYFSLRMRRTLNFTVKGPNRDGGHSSTTRVVRHARVVFTYETGKQARQFCDYCTDYPS